jgi:hypothetical protein
MTGHGVSDSDMPTFPWQTQAEARALDALLAGNYGRPEEAPAELRPVAEVLVALQAPPDQREVAGWGHALTEYRDMAGRPGMHSRTGIPGRSRSRRPRLVAPPLGAKLAAAAGAAAIAVLGAGAAAAYTGSLPAALQKFAHAAIAAPGVRKGSSAPAEGTGGPRGPSVTGPAAYGLCNAYQHAEEHGTASQRAVAFRNLVSAAGGVGQVTAYCASVPHPGNTNPPGRRVGQTASPRDTKHGRKPTAPPGKPTIAPGNENGNGGGNGNGNGNGK